MPKYNIVKAITGKNAPRKIQGTISYLKGLASGQARRGGRIRRVIRKRRTKR